MQRFPHRTGVSTLPAIGGLKCTIARAAKIFDSRICSIDLDVLIVREITAIFDTSVDFKMYGDTARGTPYNGSLQYFRAGARPQLWEKFDPMTSPLPLVCA